MCGLPEGTCYQCINHLYQVKCHKVCFLCHAVAAVISLFIEAMQCRFGAVGIHVAISSISRGKSNCAEVAIAMVGNFPKGAVGHLTDSAARCYLSGALPFLYDDPT